MLVADILPVSFRLPASIEEPIDEFVGQQAAGRNIPFSVLTAFPIPAFVR